MQQLTAAELTYREVGATRPGNTLPASYHHLQRQLILGHGSALFSSAVKDLFSWQVYHRCHIAIAASTEVAQLNTVVQLRVGLGPLALRIPCRVVFLVDEPQRKGWAYGTLPGHPECGEESFLISHLPDDSVLFSIRAFSKPGNRLTRMGAPINRSVQSFATGRYLRALIPPPAEQRS